MLSARAAERGEVASGRANGVPLGIALRRILSTSERQRRSANHARPNESSITLARST
jgi:hypothetical protein